MVEIVSFDTLPLPMTGVNALLLKLAFLVYWPLFAKKCDFGQKVVFWPKSVVLSWAFSLAHDSSQQKHIIFVILTQFWPFLASFGPTYGDFVGFLDRVLAKNWSKNTVYSGQNDHFWPKPASFTVNFVSFGPGRKNPKKWYFLRLFLKTRKSGIFSVFLDFTPERFWHGP